MDVFSIFAHTDAWIALATLTFLEIILGVDNIIFISILTSKLPRNQQGRARIIGLSGALVVRLLFLLGIGLIIHATDPIIVVRGVPLSTKDLILLLGGLFLLAKSTSEIHEKVTAGNDPEKEIRVRKINFSSIVFQVILLDVVFSFDSILTAIGLTEHMVIMVLAIIISMVVMLIFINLIADFIVRYPTLQILGLSFLILIGTMLMVEAFHIHVPKGYIYFAFFYAFAVEMINMRIRSKQSKPRA